MNWIMDSFKKAFDYTGRARRKEYWLFTLFIIVTTLVLIYIDKSIGTYSLESEAGLLSTIFSLIILVPCITLSIRRLHDSDHTGWWLLISFIPLIGGLVLLYFMVLDSNPGENEYGVNPKSLAV